MSRERNGFPIESVEEGMNTKQILLAVSLIALAVYLYQIFLILASLPPLGGVGFTTLLTFSVSLTHAIYTLGWRHTLAFLAICFAVSWSYEQVGVATGWIYGPYYYTDYLGIKLGHVPLLIPMAWFMVIYPSYIMANLIGQDCVIGTPQKSIWWLWLSLLSSFIMTAWDLVVDPLLTLQPYEAWVWTEGGSYFGIPAQNFGGWLVTTFTVYLIYRAVEMRWRPAPMLQLTRSLAAIPLILYGSLIVLDGFSGNGPEPLPIIAIFAMGGPLLMAIARWARYRVPE